MFPDAFRTDRLTLRPVEPSDAHAIFHAYAQDPDVTRFLTWRPHRHARETEAYVASCAAAASRTYVLVGRHDGVLRGAFDLRQGPPHCLSVGYVLARPWWGQGLMAEALTEVAQWAMAQAAVWRIGAVCDVDNLASAKVMEKAGLVREGLLRRWIIHPNTGDVPRDCYGYAKTR